VQRHNGVAREVRARSIGDRHAAVTAAGGTAEDKIDLIAEIAGAAALGRGV